MPYTRQEFLNLFDEADPYDDIFGDFEFYINQVPTKIGQAKAYHQTWSLSSRLEWSGEALVSLSNWMTSIEETIKLIAMWGGWQGTGNALLDVVYYNSLFDKVTAERIMQAWINTTKTKRLMTILTIDELRREVWNEEIVSYKIAPALGDR